MPSYWMFGNTPPGTYNGNDWDMRTVLERSQYYLRVSEKNRSRVQVGDVGVMRVFIHQYFSGTFRIAGTWQDDPNWASKEYREPSGYFSIEDVDLWKRPLPMSLVWQDLSTKDQRSRLVSLTRDDVQLIKIAQSVYQRLGFGSAEGEVVVLEKGLEEAIKPNLPQLGLQLANEEIRQQFSMGPGVGRSDLICTDAKGNLIVLELKRGMSSNETVGQVLTYVGFVRENIALPDQKVSGWIVTGSYDESLRLAAAAADVRVLVVRLP